MAISSLAHVLSVFVLAVSMIVSITGAAAAEMFIVGVEDNQYLPHYSYEHGEYKGYARELLDAFFEHHNYAHEYRALPVERLHHSLVDGQIDFKYPDNETWRLDIKQDSPVIYSDTVAVYIDGVSVVPEKLGQKIDRLKVLATVRGFATPPWFYRIADGQLKLVENDSFQGMVEQAIIGRVDGVYANVDVVHHLLTDILQQPGALQFDTSMPYSQGNYRLSTLKRPEVVAEFNRWLQQHTDFVYALKKKYNILNISKLDTER